MQCFCMITRGHSLYSLILTRLGTGGECSPQTVPFVLTPHDGQNAAELIRALGDTMSTDEILEVVTSALSCVSPEHIAYHQGRFEFALSGLEDSLGAEAFALSVLLSSCEFVSRQRGIPIRGRRFWGNLKISQLRQNISRFIPVLANLSFPEWVVQTIAYSHTSPSSVSTSVGSANSNS